MTDEFVVHGTRHRRPGLIVVGCLCLLPAPLILRGSLAVVNWYHLKPDAWVMNDLRSSSVAVSRKALRELARRIQAGGLSFDHQSRVISVCLTEQGRPTAGVTSPMLSDHVDFLGDAYLGGFLTDAQAETFFLQLTQLELQVRPRVELGHRVPFRVTARSRCPSASWWIEVVDHGLLVDNREWRSGIVHMRLSGTGGESSHGSGFTVSDPGKHTFVVALTILAHSGPRGSQRTSTLHDQRAVELRKTFEVLAIEPDDAVKMVGNPALAAELRRCMTPGSFEYNQRMAGYIAGRIVVQALPANVAFEVIARVNDEEISAGTLLRHRGEASMNYHISWTYDGAVIESFDLILRSSESLVRGSVDLFEAWEGELVYENLPIAGGPNAKEE